MKLGRLAARAVIGGLFVGHGTQKLFGSFGGPGIEGTSAMMDSLQMRPTKANAYAAGLTETAGGAALAVGFATPLAAASLIGTMITAIRKVHLKNGPWAAKGGYEYNLVLIAALLAIVDGGPGEISLDRALGIDDTGQRWALAALATGVASSVLAVELGRRGPAAPGADYPDEPQRPAADTDGTAGDPVTKESPASP
jgi:putative oxidoreductase